MCQISLYVEKDGHEELMFEDVTNLSIEEKGVTVSTLFEGSRELTGTVLRSIDFMGGKILLETVK